jgi:hypothetical protein
MVANQLAGSSFHAGDPNFVNAQLIGQAIAKGIHRDRCLRAKGWTKE